MRVKRKALSTRQHDERRDLDGGNTLQDEPSEDLNQAVEATEEDLNQSVDPVHVPEIEPPLLVSTDDGNEREILMK